MEKKLTMIISIITFMFMLLNENMMCSDMIILNFLFYEEILFLFSMCSKYFKHVKQIKII